MQNIYSKSIDLWC